LGSETGFLLWGEEKARIRAFFLSRSALSLFFALFFLRAFALFFWLRARERKSAKERKKRQRPPLSKSSSWQYFLTLFFHKPKFQNTHARLLLKEKVIDICFEKPHLVIQ
jgi:hypothetical protein